MIESLEKQLEAKKFEMATDRTKFCLDYLKERGYFVVNKGKENLFDSSIPLDQKAVTKYRPHLDDNLIAARCIMNRYEIENAPNVSYIQKYVQEKLSHQLALEIMETYSTDIRRELLLEREAFAYTLQLGVRSNK